MKTIGIAVIGMGWMGCAHARSFAAASRFPDAPLRARLAICADENPSRAAWARDTFGFAACSDDWREAVASTDADVVCIAAPTFLHADMVEAAAAAGKHVYCEKPVGRSAAETARAALAVRNAGVLSAAGYNYRHFPMARYCKQLLEEGKFGKVEQFNARFLSMYGGDPLSRLSWRFQNEFSGSGAVGDILSHAADMGHFLAGPIRRVSAMRKTFIAERPLAKSGGDHFALGDKNDPKGAVENEDYVAAMAEFEGGARGVLEASRVARGPKCAMNFEVYGERGSAKWDFERMNELQLYLPDGDPSREGYARLLGGVAHPGHAQINPGDGIGVGYEDSKTLEAFYFMQDIAAGRQKQGGMEQALAAAKVNDAVLRSCESGGWETVADGETTTEKAS